MTAAKPAFAHLTTRQLLAAYAETATWDHRKDQYADALDARGYNWGDHDATDWDDRHERELEAMGAVS